MNTQEFISHVNGLRLANKNKWYYFSDIVNGKAVSIKAYGTYLQIFLVNGANITSPMDMNVTAFKSTLERGANHE